MRSVWGVLKVHFCTGSMIFTAPAMEMKGICSSSARGMTARDSPDEEPPRMMSTLSFLTRRLKKFTASLALPPVS